MAGEAAVHSSLQARSRAMAAQLGRSTDASVHVSCQCWRSAGCCRAQLSLRKQPHLCEG